MPEEREKNGLNMKKKNTHLHQSPQYNKEVKDGSPVRDTKLLNHQPFQQLGNSTFCKTISKSDARIKLDIEISTVSKPQALTKFFKVKFKTFV